MNRFANLLSPGSPKASGGVKLNSARALGGSAAKQKCYDTVPRPLPDISVGKKHESTSLGGCNSVRSWHDYSMQAPGRATSSYYNT